MKVFAKLIGMTTGQKANFVYAAEVFDALFGTR